MSMVRPDDAPAASESDAHEPRNNVSATLLALSIVALGAYVVFEAISGADNPGYAVVGPGVFPFIFGVALVLVGLALLVQGLRGQWQVIWAEPDTLPAHSRESGNPPPPFPPPLTGEGEEGAQGPRLHGDERKSSAPLFNVLLVGAALVLDVALIAPLGFVVASALLFTLVSAAFGNRRFVLNAALGLAFGAAIYVVFVYGLGLSLPAGSIWESLPWMS